MKAFPSLLLFWPLAVLLPATAASAQGPELARHRAAPLGEDQSIVLEQRMSRARERSGLFVHGPAPARVERLGTGAAVGAVEPARRGDQALLAWIASEGRRPLHLQAFSSDGGRGDSHRLALPASLPPSMPFAVAIAPRDAGYAVFFQLVEDQDPSAAHTLLVQTDLDGRPEGPGREVPVPWSLAAAAWNGDGYHLALLYPGDSRGMRLSMVSLTVDGQPEQHPDWASGPGYIDDVRLRADGDAIHAFYRGGPGGDRLLSRDVSQIRSWGQEPEAPRRHGALGGGDTFVVRGDQPEVLRRPR